ncbi:MAG TPA: ABC transporter, partial [Cellulomonas sp.]|nr:ABC transporter [Cellulomonas sp.]
MSVVEKAVNARSAGGVRALYAGNARVVVARGLLATKSTNWVVVFSGFFEPVFYLLAMG